MPVAAAGHDGRTGGGHASSPGCPRLLLSLLLVGTPARAITGNWVPDFEHEYVGLIVFYDAEGEFLWRCSGSLLTDRVFLTAGHCTDQDAEESPVSARIYFEQDAGSHYDPATGVDPVSGYPETGASPPTPCMTTVLTTSPASPTTTTSAW